MLNQLYQSWQHKATHQQVWLLAVPMILSNLTVPLVGLVNSSVMGHLPSSYQLGAVAVGSGFYAFLAALAGTLRMGTTGFAAQANGKQEFQILRNILLQSIVLAVVFAILFAFIAIPIVGFVLQNMNASKELTDNTSIFFNIRLLGLPAIMIQHAIVGWFLGVKNARYSMIIMIVTNIINIILILFLVLSLGWGVSGAAAASVLSEWSGVLVGCFLVYIKLRQTKQLIDWQALKKWINWKPLLQANRDIFVRTLALQAVFLSITLRGANLGDDIVAANALLLNGLMVCAFALDGLAHALEAMCGNAIGANDKTALQQALVVSGGWSLLVSLFFAIGFVVFGDLFIALQTNIQSVMLTANEYILYLAALPIIAVWSYLLDGLFIGATKAKEMRNTMLFSVITSLPIALLLSDLQNHGLWLALLIFMTIRAIVMGYAAWKIKF